MLGWGICFQDWISKRQKTAEARPKTLRGVRYSHVHSQFHPSCRYSKSEHWHRRDTTRTSASAVGFFFFKPWMTFPCGHRESLSRRDKRMIKLPASSLFDQVTETNHRKQWIWLRGNCLDPDKHSCMSAECFNAARLYQFISCVTSHWSFLR